MVLGLLKRRASVRVFRDAPVPHDVVAKMTEAGRLSPSGGNEQPWLFGVVTDRRLIRAIADASYGQDWIASAPLIVVLCAVVVADERGGRDVLRKRFPVFADLIAKMPFDLYSVLTLEEHQTKIAGAHMALVALEHGVASTWVSLFDVERVAGLLRLPAGVVPSEMLALGYPATAVGRKPKKPKDEVVFHDTFGRRSDVPDTAVTVRPAVAGDSADVKAIYDREVRTAVSTMDVEPRSEDAHREWFESHQVAQYPLLVAEIDGRVVGWGTLSPWSPRGGYSRTAEASVFVRGGFRRQGAGRALLSALVEAGRQQGHRVVLGRIEASNEASLALARSVGFTSVGVMHRVGEKFGRVLDLELLELVLDRADSPWGRAN